MVIAPGWIGTTFIQYYNSYDENRLEIVRVVNPSRQKAEDILEIIKSRKSFNKLILLYTENIPKSDLKNFKRYLDDNLMKSNERDFRNKKIFFYNLNEKK